MRNRKKMQLKVVIKQLGKKRPIGTETIEIDDFKKTPMLSDLITNVVKQQVQEFNEKREKSTILPFISKENIDTQTQVGKVGFGAIYNTDKADEREAVENALLAFKDGLFCVFIDEEEISELTQEITITEQSTLAFVRLTFLAGSIW